MYESISAFLSGQNSNLCLTLTQFQNSYRWNNTIWTGKEVSDEYKVQNDSDAGGGGRELEWGGLQG